MRFPGAALVALVATGCHPLPPVGLLSAFGGGERCALRSVLLGCFQDRQPPCRSLAGSLPSECQHSAGVGSPCSSEWHRLHGMNIYRNPSLFLREGRVGSIAALFFPARLSVVAFGWR